MNETIDITGLDRVAVLVALYGAARPQGMGFLQYVKGPLPLDEAQELLKRSFYFDYLKGRVMKVDLSSSTLDPWGFDRDNGAGAAARVIAELRATGKTNSPAIEALHNSGTERRQDRSGIL